MKHPHASQLIHRTDGSVLISAAVAASVLAILIGGFLTFISNEYALNLRSHVWTQSLHLAEAGVDVAFAEFNYYYAKGSNSFTSGRGWSWYGGSDYLRTVSSLHDNNGKNLGAMYSYVHSVGTSSPWVSGYGNCATTPRGPTVWRRVDVVLKGSYLFPAGMVAKHKIDMNGNNVTTDSYDSTDASKSTNKQYDSTKKQPNGDIASNDTVTNTVDVTVGNANIHGKVLLSPSGSVTMGPNGEIGPMFTGAATTVADAQAAGYLRNDFQVDVPDTSVPAGASSWTALPSTGTITSGDYKGTTITSAKVINGNVRIYLTGDSQSIKLSGSGDGITILPNSSLTVYFTGSVDLTGNGLINTNAFSSPIKAQFYGTSTATDVKIAGNAQFVGVMYAPYAAIAMKGGGSSGAISGSVVGDNITLTGGTNFHYDESLRKTGPGNGYNMASWKSYRYDATPGTWVSD